LSILKQITVIRILAPLVVVGWLTVPVAFAQDAEDTSGAQDTEETTEEEPEEAEQAPSEPVREIVTDRPPKGPESGGDEVTLNFVDIDLLTLLERFADWKRMNFILGDKKELEGKKVSIISHHPVPIDAAYEAFLSAMKVHGFTLVETNGMVRVIKASEAKRSPISVGLGAPGGTEQVMTRLITLKNVDVSDVSKVVTDMVSEGAQITAYATTNTLILTDTANNIRKIDRLLRELDVAAPRSTLAIYPLTYADASEIKAIIEQIYSSDDTSSSSKDSSRSSRSSSSSRSSRSSRSRSKDSTPTEASKVGESSKYISKLIDDERTNAVIVLANEQGHAAVEELIAKLDVDVDPQNRAQIHVVHLEHAIAEEVAGVLSELSEQGSEGSERKNNQKVASKDSRRTSAASGSSGKDSEEGTTGAIAAFDSGMRIAADENTNSLVIIANQEDYRVVAEVIRQLDAKRHQVYVDAIILEIGSDDSLELGLATHLPLAPSDNAVGLIGAQMNANSLALSQDMLSGLAAGVFGQTIDVPFGMDGTTIPVPAFGIVLNAIKTNSSVNIISNPNILTLDNEEAKIVVGRKIPFPTQAGMNNLGQPVVSFQREDVAITLQVTPRINSQNFVTLEVALEVSEIEEDNQGLDVSQSGFITSKREIETVALVRDNQTVVLGGLVGTTDTNVEAKVPVLGDIPLIGSLFRGSRSSTRKTNLMVFLTPHIIDDDDDMWEIQRVKEAQRQEFLRRFYGKSRDDYLAEMRSLLRYSMNDVESPSMFRGPTTVAADLTLGGEALSEESLSAIDEVLAGGSLRDEPGDSAGELPDELNLVVEDVADEVPMEDEAESVSLDGEDTDDASTDDEPAEEAPVESGAE
jgi:general secretion pathway protein D